MSELLEPAALAKLRSAGLRAQRIAEGLWAGIHPSRLKGASIEFSEHKQYAPGDELRHLDWKVLAKSDRLFVKQFEDETNIQAYWLIDSSGSMGYASGEETAEVDLAHAVNGAALPLARVDRAPATKLHYATMMAAGLSHLLITQQDAVGLSAGNSEGATTLPPRRGPRYLLQLLETLEDLRASGAGSIAKLVRPVLESQRRRSLVVLFSDLFDAREEDWTALRQLRARGNEVAVFQILDPFEVSFPFQGWSDFEGLEGEEPVQVDPQAQREDYLRRFSAFLNECRERCSRAEIAYIRSLTTESLDTPLLAFLLSRRTTRR